MTRDRVDKNMERVDKNTECADKKTERNEMTRRRNEMTRRRNEKTRQRIETSRRGGSRSGQGISERTQTNQHQSISGLVAEYIVAMDVTRVRFPVDALFSIFFCVGVSTEALKIKGWKISRAPLAQWLERWSYEP